MRTTTARDKAIRKQTAAWLSSFHEDGLTDTEIAVAMMPEEKKAEILGHPGTQRGEKYCKGKRRLQQDAPRPNRAWRLEKRTPNADNAFKLGEALQRLGRPRVFGLYAAYKLGYTVEVGQALFALAKKNAVLPALAFYTVLPLMDGEEHRLRLLAAESPPTGKQRLKKDREQWERLITLAIARAGNAYNEAWENRDSIRIEPQEKLFFQSLSLSERTSANLKANAETTWLCLLNNALGWASSLFCIHPQAPEIKLGIVSLAADIGKNQDVLIDSLLSRLDSSESS